MEFFIIGLHVTLCFFLILVVLLQPGKGADFGAAMGGASQDVFGAGGSVTLLTKLTAIVAMMFMATSLALAWFANADDRRGSGLGADDLLDELGSEPTPGAEATPAVPPEPSPVLGDDDSADGDDDSAHAGAALPPPAAGDQVAAETGAPPAVATPSAVQAPAAAPPAVPAATPSPVTP